MKSSPIQRRLRLVAPAAVAVFCLAAAGCPKPGEAPAAGSGAAGGDLQLTLTVNPPDAQGRRSASVKLEAPSPMKDGQLAFELPAECKVLAGAAVRPVKGIGAGKAVSQELAFECAAGATGSLKVKFTGADAEGKPLERTAEGAL